MFGIITSKVGVFILPTANLIASLLNIESFFLKIIRIYLNKNGNIIISSPKPYFICHAVSTSSFFSYSYSLDNASTLIEIMIFSGSNLCDGEKLLELKGRGYTLFRSWTLGIRQLIS
jgi:hypothetical protein